MLLFHFVSLCRPCSNRVKGLPFRPVKSVPVDMFPHTHHCELVVLFERVTEETSAGGHSKMDES